MREKSGVKKIAVYSTPWILDSISGALGPDVIEDECGDEKAKNLSESPVH
jgi:hypothetical protein